MNVRDEDERRALKFLATHKVPELIEKYDADIDAELLSDVVKLGCYLMYRENGMAHWLAAMQACRRAPQMKGSDRTVNQALRRNMNGIKPDMLDIMVKRARAAGVSTQGKFYVGGLADSRGVRDPQAWVSTSDDILAVARQRNYTVRGSVNHQGREAAPPKRLPYDATLMRQYVRQALQKDPALREQVAKKPAALRNLKAQLQDRHFVKRSI